MQEKQATIYDIAEEARVSTASVSRVLSGHPNVSRKMRDKVMAVVERHQYTPSSLAQGLEMGKSHTVGVILPEVSNPYFARLYCAADEEARRRGYSVWLYQLAPSTEHVGRDVVDRLIQRRLDGAFFVGGIVETDNPEIRDAISKLRRYMPVVAICPPIKGLDCICLYNDLDTVIKQEIRHLHTLGHERIAFLGGSTEVRRSGARGRSFLESLEELGLEDNPLYHHEGGYTPETGERAVIKLLNGLGRKEWPTALVCFNDLVALGVIKRLQQMGLSVPVDMAVVGCDNSFFAAYTTPPMTTIDLHPEEHAQSAITELLSAGIEKVAPFTQARDATLVIRESCGVKLGRRHFG